VDPRALLDAARAVAAEAGRAVLDHYARPSPVDYKADDSPLTIADRASHELIAGRLADLTPDIPLLSEEGDPDNADRAGWQRFWCVDPLDGTKEFVKRRGTFTVNIALVEAGEAVLGVVHVPTSGLTYYAARGVGAFRHEADGEPLALHTRPAPAGRLTVVASRDHAGPGVGAMVEEIRAAGLEVELASMGSALKFCLVAEGAADLYPRFGPMMEWDTAAAQAIVEAAGGRVTDLAGRPLRYNKESLVNPPIVTVGDSSFDWRPFVPPEGQ
jgi:3'(2'), 5'-bisphosphate nucleotidase